MLNLDTHILICLLDGALNAREHQLVAQEPLVISDIVLWELAKLVQLGRITLDLTSPAFLACVNQLTVIPISLEIARVSTQLDFRSDPADELIAATSLVAGIPLLTRDNKILVNKAVMTTNVSGSVALTLKSRWAISRVSANAPAIPMATPISTNFIPCPMISRNTSLTCAPSAIRMPISETRCVTE